MTHADRAGQVDPRRNGGYIFAKVSPAVRWRRLAAAAMSASIDSVAAASRKTRNNLIPAAPMEPSRMAKEDRGLFAGPFPKRDLNSIYRESMFDGHF